MLKKDEVMMYPSSVKTIKLTEELNTFILNMRYLKKNLTLFFKKSRFFNRCDRIRTCILWFWRPLQSHLCYTPMNWASWIRTSKYSSQSAVPYHLAIAQKFFYILNMRDFTKNIFHI